MELERARLRFKYGDNKIGEVTFLGDEAFILRSLEKREDLLRATVSKDGSLLDAKPCKPEDMEKVLSDRIRIRLWADKKELGRLSRKGIPVRE